MYYIYIHISCLNKSMFEKSVPTVQCGSISSPFQPSGHPANRVDDQKIPSPGRRIIGEILFLGHTADGRYPAPPGMYQTLEIIEKTWINYLVQDFLHQQYRYPEN